MLLPHKKLGCTNDHRTMEVKRDFCTLPLKRLGLFFKEVFSAHQGCII